ncbi:hypothetical protein H5410_058937 [Solanum commersonii]|uniref:Uncharacterized protein n=1 Tax=Solanum commersonii TaxID=4109 RepID=A0A9J5W106_SOLCO|nr:hypothetical protein H5410_058937 [Solanum commersonii]
MSKPSQSHFPQLVHHRGHSHLLPNNLVPNPIAPSVTTHPSQHPHLRDMHFFGHGVLGRQHSLHTTRPRQAFISSKQPHAMCDILIDVTTSWILHPRYLKLSLLNDPWRSSLPHPPPPPHHRICTSNTAFGPTQLNPLDSNACLHTSISH